MGYIEGFNFKIYRLKEERQDAEFLLFNIESKEYNQFNKKRLAEILFKEIGENNIIKVIYSIHNVKSDQEKTYYNKAIKAKYADPIVLLKLADCLKAQQKYPEAIVEYNNYKKEVPDDVKGENGAKSCELAQQWRDAKNTAETRLKVENVASINSK